MSVCPSAFHLSYNQQHNVARKRDHSHDRQQLKCFRFIGSHLDGTEIDDIFPGRLIDARISERINSDHGKQNSCQLPI